LRLTAPSRSRLRRRASGFLQRALSSGTALVLAAAAYGGEAGAPVTRSIVAAGAVADGRTLNTAVINRVVTEVSESGGGVVYVPPGVFLTGTIYLKNRVTLHLAGGAVLLGSTELQDYPENPAPPPADTPEFKRISHLYPASLEFGRYSLVCADGQHDVAITGQGRIDGQGHHTNFTKQDLIGRGASKRDAYLKRPYGLSFVRCQGVTVRDITLHDLAFWSQDYLDCDDVRISGVTVDSKKLDYNNDGLDLDGSRNVRVSDCYFNVGDDAICFKSSFRDCENITIANCVLSSLANGVKFGTASIGSFRNIAISNLTMENINAAGLALEIVDGGTMDGIVISNIVMNRVGTAVFLKLGDRGQKWMDPAKGLAVGRLRNISISNIVAHLDSDDFRPLCGSISGLPGHPVEDVTISNMQLILHHSHTATAAAATAAAAIPEEAGAYPEYSMFGPLPASGLYIRHAKGIVLRDIDLRFVGEDYRSALVCDDVQDLDVQGWRSPALAGAQPVVCLRGVRRARIAAGVASAGTDTYLRVTDDSSDILLTGSDLAHARLAVSADPSLSPSAITETANRR